MTYLNPVVPGFHPDPSVCRVGDDYYLATSSFTYFPGVPIFRSDNLVDWTLLGNALDRTSQLDLSATTTWSSLGIYAPTLRHRDGRFWLITTNVTSSGATTFIVTSEHPSGPWSEPIRIDIPGIDPDLAWDPDGNCWVHFSGLGGIARTRIDTESGAILEGPELTWSGSGLQYPEAPHLFERQGLWYLLIAEGGTERGHCVSIARGPSPTGPWEGAPTNPILSHRSTNSPIQNTGHADLVEALDGAWWMVLLGVRPHGMSPRFHVLGRETFLTSVGWVDGWPQPAEVVLEPTTRPAGRSGQTYVPGTRDDFDENMLAPHWVALRRPPTEISSLTTRPGWLTLFGTDATLGATNPAYVARRQQHHKCLARSRVDLGSATEAGVAVMLDTAAHYEVAVTPDRIVVRARIGPLESLVANEPRPAGPVTLTLETKHAEFAGPDTVCLGYENGSGARRELAQLDGRYLSTEVTGGFLGRTIGMYAVDGEAAFDWFEYEAL